MAIREGERDLVSMTALCRLALPHLGERLPAALRAEHKHFGRRYQI